MTEKYINGKVRQVLEVMLDDLLEEEVLPDNPIPFMYDWILKYLNTIPEERTELQNLREEKEKINKEINERKSKSTKNVEINKKQSKLSLNSPSSIIKKETSNILTSESEGEEKDDIEGNMDEEEFSKKVNERRNKLIERGQRSGVSAEAFGKFNKKENFKARSIPKTQEQINAIKTRCLNSFIFNSLEDNELGMVIDACEEKKYKKGDFVIKQDENGDEVFVVGSGELECEKIFKKGDKPTHLVTYKTGDSFGELALLYGAPRAATIYCLTDCVLWALDRNTFNNIVKDSAINKREKYKKILQTIPILSTMTEYEIYSICDAIKSEKIAKDQIIITEGEEGNKFYILDEGEAKAFKNTKQGKKQIKDYKKGEYFGELALLKNAARAASIISQTDCKLLTLDRTSFKRLLGPLQPILERNSEMYKKYS